MERRTDTKIGKTKCHAIEPSFWKKPPIVFGKVAEASISPLAGNHPKSTANTLITIAPKKYVGRDMPNIVNTVTV